MLVRSGRSCLPRGPSQEPARCPGRRWPLSPPGSGLAGSGGALCWAAQARAEPAACGLSLAVASLSSLCPSSCQGKLHRSISWAGTRRQERGACCGPLCRGPALTRTGTWPCFASPAPAPVTRRPPWLSSELCARAIPSLLLRSRAWGGPQSLVTPATPQMLVGGSCPGLAPHPCPVNPTLGCIHPVHRGGARAAPPRLPLLPCARRWHGCAALGRCAPSGVPGCGLAWIWRRALLLGMGPEPVCA